MMHLVEKGADIKRRNNNGDLAEVNIEQLDFPGNIFIYGDPFAILRRLEKLSSRVTLTHC